MGCVSGIQHAVTLTSEAYEWPNMVARLSMTLLVIGLPVAMTLAWYHGEKASRRVSGPELTIISLLLLTSSLLFAVLVHPAGITTPRAQEATNAQELRNSAEALALLESVIAKNPNYAPGWHALGGAYAVQLNNITGDGGSIEDARRAVDELRPKGEDALQKAIRLDSNLADPYVLLAYFARSRGHLIAAEEFLKNRWRLIRFVRVQFSASASYTAPLAA